MCLYYYHCYCYCYSYRYYHYHYHYHYHTTTTTTYHHYYYYTKGRGTIPWGGWGGATGPGTGNIYTWNLLTIVRNLYVAPLFGTSRNLVPGLRPAAPNHPKPFGQKPKLFKLLGKNILSHWLPQLCNPNRNKLVSSDFKIFASSPPSLLLTLLGHLATGHLLALCAFLGFALSHWARTHRLQGCLQAQNCYTPSQHIIYPSANSDSAACCTLHPIALGNFIQIIETRVNKCWGLDFHHPFFLLNTLYLAKSICMALHLIHQLACEILCL